LLYHLNAAGDAIARIEALLAQLPGSPAARALVLCLPFGAFFEAISGFGTGVVMVGPLLRGLGYRPERAALLSLLTQNAVPWGALAVGVVLSGELAGLPLDQIGLLCAALTAPLFPYFAGIGLVLAGGWAALRTEWRLWALIGFGTGVALLGATWLAGTELGMVVAAPVVAGVAVALLRRGISAGGLMTDAVVEVPRRSAPRNDIRRDLLPYALLVALLLVTRLVPPLRAWLSAHLVLDVPAVGFSLPLLYSPGFPLLVACLASVALLRPPLAGALTTTTKQWLRATAALVAFVTLSELMLRSGMTERLAFGTAGLFGSAYLVAAPWLGGLSGFVTGSNAAGAAMLLPFQLRMAEQLGISRLLITALQNAAAAAGSLASPQRIVLAATVLGFPREEGRLVRAALLVEVGVMAILTLAALVGQALSSPASP
jgi:lactate permease